VAYVLYIYNIYIHAQYQLNGEFLKAIFIFFFLTPISIDKSFPISQQGLYKYFHFPSMLKFSIFKNIIYLEQQQIEYIFIDCMHRVALAAWEYYVYATMSSIYPNISADAAVLFYAW